MPDRGEVISSLYGACRLALMDRSGLAHFNLTFEGFWRSFFAAVLGAPGFALLVVQKLAARPEPLDPGWAMLVQLLAYGLSWAAFPLAAVLLTRLLGLSQNYVALIVALNWWRGGAAGGLPRRAAARPGAARPARRLIMMLVTGGILFYQWFVTRSALQTTGGVALMLVLVDLVLNSAIHVSADRLM